MTTNTIALVSAFSGLAGVLLSQLMTGLFSYYSDRRKNRSASRIAFRDKKVEIGEYLYYVNTETMAILQKNILYWKNWNDSRSPLSIDFLQKERNTVNERLSKINAENWKYNLATLYFEVELSIARIHELNSKSQLLFLAVLDVTDRLKHTGTQESEALYATYAINVFDLCGQYQQIHDLLESDIRRIKAALSQSFRQP
ncbi:hypothetical protein [Mucilaginibacter agri]|uniref:Uncharacterized protein n=1 Tax=Mucilaginibacter agri TaxID=2695265 RepID=A0A965ZC19_9SPHI|nr:hypothetical protein [Mucilaginibacter agri]NCD68253.1 hypothetical protein [Mucilaginibacter agri]